MADRRKGFIASWEFWAGVLTMLAALGLAVAVLSR